jgi:hypothetical protein
VRFAGLLSPQTNVLFVWLLPSSDKEALASGAPTPRVLLGRESDPSLFEFVVIFASLFRALCFSPALLQLHLSQHYLDHMARGGGKVRGI